MLHARGSSSCGCVATRVGRQTSRGIAKLEWPPRWVFPVGAIVAAAVLIVLTACLPYRVRSYVSPTASGLIFGLGLGCSGPGKTRS